MTNLAGKPPLGQKTGNPKPSAAGKAHMAKVAALPCVICGARPASVHHCISARFGQRKASDFETISLCYFHHQGADGIHTSKRAWERKYGLDTDYLPVVAAMIQEGQCLT